MKLSSPFLRIVSYPLFVSMGLIANAASAASYGIYEARGLAMGGAVVASSNLPEAHYYNPALLAYHEGDEDVGQDNHFNFDMVLQGSGPIDSLMDFYDEEYDVVVTEAVEAFNATPGPASADLVLSAVEDMDAAADELGKAPVDFDGTIGFSFNLPGDHEGGTFFMASRMVGNEKATITDADQAVLEDYRQAMIFVSSGGAEGDGTAIDRVFVNGELVDPKEFLTSTARVSGVAVTEFGLAFGKAFEFGGLPVALGITPKAQRFIVYSQVLDFADDIIEIDYAENADSFVRANLDLGATVDLQDGYRIGLSVKDVFKQDYTAENGASFSMGPRARLGGALNRDAFTLAADLDLLTSPSWMGEGESQELALGGAYRPTNWVELRGGYRFDIQSNLPDMFSLGAGFQMSRFNADLSYAIGNDYQGIGMKMGWAF
ncbi:MAG: conjugal transfer protein TraF [Hahellaceae bacterium]|nr:conjugal transfer protein TraF [Hahellaceae bacterium]